MKEVSFGQADDKPNEAKTKLCLDVIEENFAAKTGRSKVEFDESVQTKVGGQNLSRELLNEKYMGLVSEEEKNRHGAAAGENLFEEVKAKWSCK
jgi:hypothetical protein